LFASYRVESLHNNEIHLEFHIDNLQRALRSAHNSQSAVLKLTKKQNLPVLSLSVQSMSSTGHTTLVCQDVPVRVLTPEQVRAMREPEVPDAHVHIMMPELSTIRSVVERMRLMGDRVTVAANNEGQLTLRVASDRVDITTYWRGLANMTYDASEQPQAHEFSVATVDMRNFCRFLHSYHVAPKNFNAQMGGQPGNPPMRGAFSPIDQQQQQFAYGNQAQQPQQPQQPYQQQQSYQQQPQQPYQQQQPNYNDPYNMFAQNIQNNQAAQLGMQFAGSAMTAMQENVHQNVSRYVSMPQLKQYFDVTNIYVLAKLRILVFPWLQRNWHRLVERDSTGQVSGHKAPRDDSNAPDLYIPCMALVS
ncbi:Checkpoint protein hus1, partial [Coemansia sp. RSA 454]